MLEHEITKEWLYEQYVTLGKTAFPICQEFKIKHTNIIMKKLEEFGIPKKKKGRTKETSSTDSNGQEIPKEEYSFFIGEEEFKVRDRVRLGETINGVKESNLCEITKIYKPNELGEIKVEVLTVMNHSKLTVMSSSLVVV